VELARVAEAAEEQVPQREVAVVAGVHALAVVDAVRLRALDQVADPDRRAHVPVLEHAMEGRDHADPGRGQRVEPERQHGDEQLQQHLHDHLERMEQGRPLGVWAADGL